MNIFVTQFFSELTKSDQTLVKGAGISLSIGPQMVVRINSCIMVVTPNNGDGIPAHFGPRNQFDGLDMACGLADFATMPTPTGGARAFFPKV